MRPRDDVTLECLYLIDDIPCEIVTTEQSSAVNLFYKRAHPYKPKTQVTLVLLEIEMKIVHKKKVNYVSI